MDKVKQKNDGKMKWATHLINGSSGLDNADNDNVDLTTASETR